MMEEDKLCSPKTFSAATSPIKDTLQLRYDSRELGKKLVSRDVQTDKYSAGGIFHSSSSSEKVQQAFFVEDAKLLIHQFFLSNRDRSNNGQYLNVLFGFKYFCELTNIFWFSVQVFGGKSGSRESNATKSTWGQITETVKEKLETVGRRGRRYSKEQGERWAPCGSGDSDHFLLQHLFIINRERNERSESGHYSVFGVAQPSLPHDKLQSNKQTFDQTKETEMALEAFDTVLNSLHTDTVLTSLHSGAQAGAAIASGSGKSKKKRKDRESFKNGGTWPRARGGPIIEQGTGTILHPHKQYKERKPLSELLTNMPKYPLPQDQEEAADRKQEQPASVIYRDEAKRHSRNKYRDYRATTYDLVSGFSERSEAAPYHLMTAGTVSRERLTGGGSLSRDTSEDRDRKPGGYLASVRPGPLPLHTPSDTSIDDSVKSGNLRQYLSHKPGPAPGAAGTSDSEHSHGAHSSPGGGELVSPPPPGYHPLHQPQPRPASSGFSHQYFLTHGPGPRYSSPPPLLPHTVSGESILGSPLPRPGQFEGGLYPPLEPPPSLGSMSPSPGPGQLYGHPVSPSPCLPRGLQVAHHHPAYPGHYAAPGVFSGPATAPGLHGHRYKHKYGHHFPVSV